MSKPISAYQMGESYAQNMGLNVQLFRILLVLLSSILSACVTAFAEWYPLLELLFRIWLKIYSAPQNQSS